MRLTGMNPSSVSTRSCQDGFFFPSLILFLFFVLMCECLIWIWTHPAWKSPKEECRMTTHHSGLCTGYGRCFLVPSISKAGRSVENWKTLFEGIDFINYLCIRLNFYTYAAFWDVVGVVHDVSGQAKVTDLHKFALTDQHISGREVSMDALRRDSAEYCFHNWDFMPFMHQGWGHGTAVWVNTSNAKLTGC